MFLGMAYPREGSKGYRPGVTDPPVFSVCTNGLVEFLMSVNMLVDPTNIRYD